MPVVSVWQQAWVPPE